MGSLEQYTYWSMTLNNPDENDWILVRNPNEKYVRQLIHTREVGEQGTEHIQAWVRLQRNQSRAFMKKLWPKAHFNPIKKDEYNENCIAYAQKNDDTTGGAHVNTINDPLPANDTLLYQVLEKSVEHLILNYGQWQDIYEQQGEDLVWHSEFNLTKLKTRDIERSMVMERSGLEKIFCSPAYEKMKQTFYKEIIYRILRLQQNAGDDKTTERGDETSQIAGEGEDHEESTIEADEGSSEGSSTQTDEDYDSEGD